jgi:F-type H+-transporting ATPase subunit epsilon
LESNKDMTLNVELVSPTERVWSGQASFVSARTVEGDLGILSDHAPLFGVLVDGAVSIKGIDGSTTDFNVSGGFLSVSNNRVSILTETVSN